MKENLTNEIIERAIKGDRAAYDVIYRSCEGSIRSYITSHLNDKSQVDDVLQNTFISVYNNISRLRSPEGFKKWIFTIAYNECMSVNNNVKKEQERFISISTFTDEDGTEREFEDDSLELPEDYATNKELQKLLADELNALTSKQRDCLILYYYKHKSIPEIAKMYGLSESAIKNRKEKAIGKLKHRLEKYRGRYNFAFVPLGGLMGKLVGTGKVKSACLGTAVVSHAMSVSFIAAAAASTVAIGVGVVMITNQNDETVRKRMGDVNADSSFTTSRDMNIVEDSSLVSAPEDSSSDDSAPTDSDYTVYNESNPTEYYIDSSLDINTDSENGGDGAMNTDNANYRTEENDGTASQSDESLPELKKTDSEPEPVEEMTVEKMQSMTLRDYMNAAGGNYELVWVPDGMQDGAIGIRNLAYPNFRFVGANGVMTEGANVITISKEQYVNLKGSSYGDRSIDELKAERAEAYDNLSHVVSGYFTFDLASAPRLIQADEGADIGYGITVGMTYNEIKEKLGDDCYFTSWRPVGSGYFLDQFKGATIHFELNGKRYEIGFDLTEDERERFENARKEKQAQYSEWRNLYSEDLEALDSFDDNIIIENFNPKSSAAQISNIV